MACAMYAQFAAVMVRELHPNVYERRSQAAGLSSLFGVGLAPP